jgi:hypothetical protein
MIMKTTVDMLILALPVLVATACVDSTEAVGTQSEALLGASADSEHPFNVGVCAGGLIPEGRPRAGTCASFACSGTLIAPNLVLTAQHCIQRVAFAADFCASEFTGRLSTASPLITTSTSVRSGTPQWTDVQEVLLPPGRNLCADDVALLLLAQPIPNDVAPPARVNVTRGLAGAPPAEVAIVGRGAVGELLDLRTFRSTVKDGGLERRILQHVPFECASDGSATCSLVDFSSPPTNMFAAPASYSVVGSSLASGDSGAGVFDQAQFSSPSVIGVASASTFGADGVPNHGLISRLDTHHSFVIDGLITAGLALGLSERAFLGQAE